MPILGCFLFVWPSGICLQGCKDPRVAHHRKVSNCLIFWSFLPERVTVSQLEEELSQWSVGLPHHIVGHSVFEETNVWQTDCSWLPFLELHNLGLRPRGQIIQSWIFLRETLFRNFSSWENPLFGSDQKGWVIEQLFSHGLMGREKAVLLLPTDLHEDKCNQLQIIKLFIIQILETNFLSLKPWGGENVLSKLSYGKKGGD